MSDFVPVLVAVVAALSTIVLALLRRRPRAPATSPPVVAPNPRPSRPSLPSRRVLVVEDERAMGSIVVRILAAALPDVEIERAESGEEALAMFGAAPFDLLVIDVGLRGMSGAETVRVLREAHREPRVLLISGRPADELERLAIELDARALAKPFEAAALVDVVRELLRG